MRRAVLITAIVTCASLTGVLAGAQDVTTGDQTASWEIGPVIRGKSYSEGMPSHLQSDREGPSFDFPYPDVAAGHVHYLTFRHGPLRDGSQISIRYRIDGASGVRILPRENADLPPILSLFVQRRGDNWSGAGPYETYRWYSDATAPLTPGDHELTIRFDDQWRGVMDSKSLASRTAFLDALVNADRIGFVLGSEMGRGHGVYATGPAKFTLIDFSVS